METLCGMFGDSHKLVHLIAQCLEYSPARRPSALEALQKLQQISTQAIDCHHDVSPGAAARGGQGRQAPPPPPPKYLGGASPP